MARRPSTARREPRPAREGWEQWLDEPVPALRGLTPRQAAGSDDWPLLEALLRQLEYEADLFAQENKRGDHTAWLRDQLGMLADWWMSP